MILSRTTLGFVLSLFLALPGHVFAGVPERIHYQGHLMDSAGEPIHCPQAAVNCPSGPVNATFKLYAVPEGGAVLWEESKSNIPISQGIFHVTLGAELPITGEVLDKDFLYLGVNVNETGEMFPRQRLISTAYALHADRAQTAENSEKLGGIAAEEFITEDSIYNWCLSPESIAQLLVDGKYLNEDNAMAYLNEKGYLTSESDPIYKASPAAGIAEGDKNNWNSAYGWGDHSQAGYLKEEDNAGFATSPAGGISEGDVSDWNQAHQWGNHAAAGYVKIGDSPGVGILSEGKWCRAEGGEVVCNTEEPALQGASGGVKVTNSSTVCTSNEAGTMRWNGVSFEGCDGSEWRGLGGGGGQGTLLYNRCAWSETLAPDVGSCTPPPCALGWVDLGITGNLKNTGYSTKFGEEFEHYSEGAGIAERACESPNSYTVLNTRCSWTGDIAPDIEDCAPPSCPLGWTDLGITGNIKTSAWGQTEYPSTLKTYTGSTGYSERTCIK